VEQRWPSKLGKKCGSCARLQWLWNLSRLDIRSVNVVVLPTMPVEVAAAVVIMVIQILYSALVAVGEMIGVIGRFCHFSAR
jgi:hypothetical protein